MISNKVLLVDDNKGQRITLESILKRSGFEVLTADCGTAALVLSETQDFAAALLDIKMPDLTGIDVLKELKEKNPEMTVIMMTGESFYYISSNTVKEVAIHGGDVTKLVPAPAVLALKKKLRT
jgi:DNA-binding NtrC family response regulator